jgi:hypothetical protein
MKKVSKINVKDIFPVSDTLSHRGSCPVAMVIMSDKPQTNDIRTVLLHHVTAPLYVLCCSAPQIAIVLNYLKRMHKKLTMHNNGINNIAFKPARLMIHLERTGFACQRTCVIQATTLPFNDAMRERQYGPDVIPPLC